MQTLSLVELEPGGRSVARWHGGIDVSFALQGLISVHVAGIDQCTWPDGRLSVSVDRRKDDEACATSGLHVDAATVGAGHSGDDRETESGTAGVRGSSPVEPGEPFEDPHPVGLSNAVPIIGYGERHLT